MEIIKRLFSSLIVLIRRRNIIAIWIGFIALIWFLIRVIPKPSRAAYPCQRAAFPIASGFILWLSGIAASSLLIKRVNQYYRRSGNWFSFILILLLPLSLAMIQLPGSVRISSANSPAPVLLDPRFENEVTTPRSEVAIVRSVESRAEDISFEEIDQMVREAVRLSGGLSELIHNGDVVVIKPNLVNPSQEGHTEPLRKEVNGVTTDYRIIQSVVSLVREMNPDGKVMIMEGSAFGKTIDNMQKLGWLDITGVDQFIGIEDSSGGMREYSSDKLIKKSLPPGKNLYEDENNTYYFNKTYAQADFVISLPVMKTHSSAAFTGGIKNLAVGTAPASIYGDETGETNLRWPYINHDNSINSPLHDWIHDYYLCRPADFVIMDALTGLEYGPGISSGIDPDEVRKNTRCIIAGKDALSVDAIAALAVQVDPAKLRYLVTLHNDLAGCADPKYIRVNGLRVDQIRNTYRNTADYAKYSVFNPPRFIIQSYQIVKDSLYMLVELKSRVDKIEIAVNDTLLDEIITDGYTDIRISLGRKDIHPGQITVLGYDQYLNCSVKSLQGTSGTENPDALNATVEVYPNPFTNHISVTFRGYDSEMTRFIIYNMSGKVVKTLRFRTNMYENHQELDLSDLPDGIYILNVINGESRIRKRIIKQ